MSLEADAIAMWRAMSTAATVGGLVVVAYLGAGCAYSGREVGRTTFTGPGTREVVVTLASAGSVHFDTALEVRVPSSETSINEEWQYTIATLRGGRVLKTTTCDAFNVAPGLGSLVQIGDDLRLSRARLLGCNLALAAGPSTLRVTLAPMRGGSPVAPIQVDLFMLW